MADNIIIADKDGNAATVATKDLGSTIGEVQRVLLVTPAGVDVDPTPRDVSTLATAAKQDINHADMVAILGKLSADPATQTTLADILAELRDDVFVVSTIWVDESSSPAVYYREERVRSQDNGAVTVVFTKLSDGTTVTTLPAAAHPVAGDDRDVQHLRWRVKAGASGTGYSALQWLVQTQVIDTAGNGAVLSSIWWNLSTGAAIAAPASTDLEDPATTVLSAILAALPASLGQKTKEASLAVTIAIDQGALPMTLPSGTITPALVAATGSGTVAAGSVLFSFSNVGTASAIVAGATFPAGASWSEHAPPGKTFGAITYDATGTTLMVGSAA